MTNLDLSSLLERYEKARQQCLRYANLHPDEKAPCGTALSKVRTLPAITFHLAELLDDMAIALRLVHEPRENPQWSPEEIARMRMEQAINTCQGCFRPVSACVCSQLSRT